MLRESNFPHAWTLKACPAVELTNPAKITMDKDFIVTDKGPSKIQPGMRVAAEIKTGDRRVIDFLLSPFLQTVKEAARER